MKQNILNLINNIEIINHNFYMLDESNDVTVDNVYDLTFNNLLSKYIDINKKVYDNVLTLNSLDDVTLKLLFDELVNYIINLKYNDNHNFFIIK